MTTKLVSTGVEFPDATTQTTSGLPLTGGALTGAVTTTSTFDGRDVAADGVTADAALPKAGGTMTGTIAGFTSTGIDDNATSNIVTLEDGSVSIKAITGVELELRSTTTGIVGNDLVGGLKFRSDDTNGTAPHYSGIKAVAADTYGGAGLEFYVGRDRYESNDPRVVIEGPQSVSGEAMRIDSSGNVGIGTTTPLAALDVASATSPILHATATGTNNASLRLKGRLSVNHYWDVQHVDAENDLSFEWSGTEAARILSSGGITFNGDTAAANALDDYEEGTWILSGTRISWSEEGTTSGTYIKIGKIVHLTMSATVTNLTYDGTGSGWAFGGLPFGISGFADVQFSECTCFTSSVAAINNIGSSALFGRSSRYTSAGMSSTGLVTGTKLLKFTVTYETT